MSNPTPVAVVNAANALAAAATPGLLKAATSVAAGVASAPFDEDLMNRLRILAEDGENTNIATPVKAAITRIREPNADEQMFSDLFWSPKHVPDFPLRSFKHEDWPEVVRARIPAKNPGYRWQKEETEMFAFAMYCNDRTLLHGPTGTGKTALPQNYCAELNIPFIKISCHPQQEATDFLGKDNISFNEDKQALELKVQLADVGLGVKHGGMIVIDEAFRSPILMSIQSLLEPGGNLTLPDAAGLTMAERMLTPIEGKSWIVLTDNTNGQGSEDGKYNAEVQDLSTLDRITATIYIDYPVAREEEAILRKIAKGLSKEDIAIAAKVNSQVRSAFKKGTLQQPLSIRASILIAIKAQYVGLARAYKIAFTGKLTATDTGVFNEIWKQVTNTDFRV